MFKVDVANFDLAGGDAHAAKWLAIKESAKSGDLDAIDPKVFVVHYSSLKNIARDFQTRPTDLPAGSQIGYWFYGKSGAGKTYGAHERFPDAYRKIANNKWWDGYQGEENVVLDDLDKKHDYMGYHLKIWGDRYAFVAEFKGSSRMIRPKVVVVTSNYHPEEIWNDESTLGPIRRRFRVVHFSSWGDVFDLRNDETVPAFVTPVVDDVPLIE